MPTPDRASCPPPTRRGKRYEYPSGLRRFPKHSRPTHDRPYGPFADRAAWLAWCEQDQAPPLQLAA